MDKNNNKFKKNDSVEVFLKSTWIKGKVIDWDDEYKLYKINFKDNIWSFIPETNIRLIKNK